MGNTKSQTRGLSVARGGAPVEDDPFAELADIFESELQFDARFADDVPPHKAGGLAKARHEPNFDADEMDREFEAAFENDLATVKKSHATAAVPNYETRFNGRATAKSANRSEAPARRPSQSGSTRLTDEEIDDELDAVLRNLSAPARPRGRIVVETQSFAPERPEEERLPSVPNGDMDEFEELIRSELAVIRPAMAAAPRRQDRDTEITQQRYAAEEFEPEDDYPFVAARSSLKKALVTGVSAAALVLVAGIGFGVWHSGSAVPGVSDEPLLIKADAEPFKVAPKDPGGRAYPNQNKAVYDRVTAPDKAVDETPMQRALLKTAEEPMELPKEEERSYDDLPGVEIGDSVDDEGKSETRVTEATETAAASAEPVLQPRKVRTLTVGADGKLMQPEPVAAAKPTASASAATLHADAARPAATDAPQAADLIEVAAVAPARTAVPSARVPAPTPQPPAASQPQPAEVASAMPADGFFVQVSSQPSEAAAQQSMRSFGGRYGSVVGGRSIGIKSAEVPGKGTYWRVRVAASTKEEAASICSKLKSAGASCFVTR